MTSWLPRRPVLSPHHKFVRGLKPDPVFTELWPEHRQKWVIDQLQAGRKLTHAQFEKRFDMPSSTSKRDLKMLEKKIEFIGVGKGGYYRMKALKKDIVK